LQPVGAVRRQCSGAFSLYRLSIYTSFRHFNAQPRRSHIKPRRGNLAFPYIASQFHIPPYPQQKNSPGNTALQPAALARFSSVSGSTLTQRLFDLIRRSPIPSAENPAASRRCLLMFAHFCIPSIVSPSYDVSCTLLPVGC
jgi:hypothetical protein